MSQIYLPSDDFYTDAMVGTKNTVDMEAVTRVALEQYSHIWSPAKFDDRRAGGPVALFIVDPDYDFFPWGALPVKDADVGCRALIRLIYRQGGKIKTIIKSGDRHKPLSIYFSRRWVALRDFDDDSMQTHYKKGQHPVSYTTMHIEDVEGGKWGAIINPAWSNRYPRLLKENQRKELMIWPPHCLDSTPGTNTVAPLMEAILVHALARMNDPVTVAKGDNTESEHYSPLVLEVDPPGVVSMNTTILSLIQQHKKILVAGWASSHCVFGWMETVGKYFSQYDRTVLESIYFLEDCSQPVAGFEDYAKEGWERMQKEYGINICKSTDIEL